MSKRRRVFDFPKIDLNRLNDPESINVPTKLDRTEWVEIDPIVVRPVHEVVAQYDIPPTLLHWDDFEFTRSSISAQHLAVWQVGRLVGYVPIHVPRFFG